MITAKQARNAANSAISAIGKRVSKILRSLGDEIDRSARQGAMKCEVTLDCELTPLETRQIENRLLDKGFKISIVPDISGITQFKIDWHETTC